MQLFSILVDVVGPVFIVALVGYAWARSGAAFDPRFVSMLVTNVATPCLVIDNLAKSSLNFSALGQIVLACVISHLLALAAGYAFVKAMREDPRVFAPALGFPNSGNMGLPLALFAFGEVGLALAIAFYATASLLQFTLGQAIAAGGASFRAIVRLPLVWAILLAVTLAVSGLSLPGPAASAVHILAGLLVPLMLLSLGYSLASLKIASLKTAAIFSLARLIGGFAIGWFVATLLGLDGVQRGVVVIQSAMPSAVFNYMFAERYNNRPEEVAGVVVISTILSVAFLPLFLLTLL